MLLITFVVLLLCVAAINIRVDSQALINPYNQHYRSFVCKLLKSDIGAIVDGNIRLIKLAMIRESKASCYISGSTRIMEFTSANWPHGLSLGCSNLVNISVYYGCFEDFVIQASELLEKPEASVFFIAMDPWIFRRNKTRLYRIVSSENVKARKTLGMPAIDIYKESTDAGKMRGAILNVRYLFENVKALRDGVGLQFRAVTNDTGDVSDDDEIVIKNGARIRSRENLKKLRERGLSFDGSNINPPYIDESVYDEFKFVLDKFRNAEKRIAFVLNPYSPTIWSCENDVTRKHVLA